MPKNNLRLERINEELKKEISHIINYELTNSNITGLISVTRAKITPDLKYAQIYVSILNAKNRNETMEALKRASGFIRMEIAKRINLRITPELIFVLDDSMEYGARIDSILKDIMKDLKTSSSSEEENK